MSLSSFCLTHGVSGSTQWAYAISVLLTINAVGVGNHVSPGVAQTADQSEAPSATPSGLGIFSSLGSGLDFLIWGWVPKLPAASREPTPTPSSTPVWGSFFGESGPKAAPPTPAPSIIVMQPPAPVATGFSPGGMLTGLLTGIGTGVVAGLTGLNGLNGGGGDGGFLDSLEPWKGSKDDGGGVEGLEDPPIFPSIEAEPYVQGPIIDHRSIWEPSVGVPFQIVLASPIQVTPAVNVSTRDMVSEWAAEKKPKIPLLPDRVDIFDVALWDNLTETVELMHTAGKKFICYFSAGTSEDWRPDFDHFNATDMGADLPL